MPRIVITPGEPAGIGPDITIQIAQREWDASLIVVADPDLLRKRAAQLNLPLLIKLFKPSDTLSRHEPGTLFCLPFSLRTSCIAGKPDSKNANYVLECLQAATRICYDAPHEFALVTGPINKSVMNEAGFAFTGHTEFLATECHAKHPVMLFVANNLRIALATTHLPLSAVPKQLTAEHLTTTLRVLHHDLQVKFHLADPRILVCGLNPHAGENGHLGSEEIEVIKPVIEKLQQEGMNIMGPLSADTIFTEKYTKTSDAILAMYHDQALPVVKYMSFGHAVNVTLGLPIIRTSVDHGTAFDLAGTGQADAGSMAAAVELAITLSS